MKMLSIPFIGFGTYSYIVASMLGVGLSIPFIGFKGSWTDYLPDFLRVTFNSIYWILKTQINVKMDIELWDFQFHLLDSL